MIKIYIDMLDILVLVCTPYYCIYCPGWGKMLQFILSCLPLALWSQLQFRFFRMIFIIAMALLAVSCFIFNLHFEVKCRKHTSSRATQCWPSRTMPISTQTIDSHTDQATQTDNEKSTATGSEPVSVSMLAINPQEENLMTRPPLSPSLVKGGRTPENLLFCRMGAEGHQPLENT